jgi:DNA-binding beta-propeller fold protein YncE
VASHRLSGVAVSFALLAVSVVLALPAPTEAAGVSDLGSVGLGTIVVDNTHRHVFVSGPTGDVVDVFDFSGDRVATIPDLPGAYGMALDSKTLYVTERSTGAIAEIDLATLAVAGSPLATGLEDPRWLALAGGKLWVTVGGQFAELASVDLTSHLVQQFGVRDNTVYEPQLAASSGHPRVLVMASEGETPGRIYRLNITGSKRV